MEDFRSGASQILAAPRLLDEGIDVPEADLGIIVAANAASARWRSGWDVSSARRRTVAWAGLLFSTPRGPWRIRTCRARSSSASVALCPRGRFFDMKTDLSRLQAFLRQPEPVHRRPREPAASTRRTDDHRVPAGKDALDEPEIEPGRMS